MSTQTSLDFAQDALDILLTEGVPVTVDTDLPGAMTPSGDRFGVTATRAGWGVVFPARGTTRTAEQQSAGERVIMTPVDPWPAPGDVVTINGRRLTVADDGAKTYAPQGVPIMHDLSVTT